MLLEKVFAILKSKNETQARIVSDPQLNEHKNKDDSDIIQEKYSSTFESNSESGDKVDKSNTSEPQNVSYSSHFESGTDESKPDNAVAQDEILDSDHGILNSPDTNDIIGSRILNSSNELSEPVVPDDDPASESQISENIPKTSVPVPEPHPLVGEPGWNVLSTIEEVTTVTDTHTGQGEQTDQEDISHSYSKTDDTYKQTNYHTDNNLSEDQSEDGIQSLSIDNKTMNSSFNQDEIGVHDNNEDLKNVQSTIAKIESTEISLTPSVLSQSNIQNDVDSLAPIHSIDVSSDISDSEKNKDGASNIVKVESNAYMREEELNLGIESLKVNIEKETTNILEDIIEEAVRISELASNEERSITPNEFVALSIHETDDDESLIKEDPDPVSVELNQKSHPDPAEELHTDAPSVTVDDTSTEAVRLSEGEVLLTGLISEGELSASDGGSLVTQSVTGLSGHLGDSDSEPGEADPRIAGARGQRRLPVSLDTSSSSSWSEGEWRASPARMRRFLNMASAFRMISKSDQE